MQASQEQQSAGNYHHLYQQQQYHYLNRNNNNINGSPEQVCFESYKDNNNNNNNNYVTLESSPPAAPPYNNNNNNNNNSSYIILDSPSPCSITTLSSSSSPLSNFSPQGSSSYLSDPPHLSLSSDNTTYYASSPASVIVDNNTNNNLSLILRQLELKLLGPESEFDDSCTTTTTTTTTTTNNNSVVNHNMDLKQALIACAEAISDYDIRTAERWMSVLEPMVSVCGDPLQRLGAYLLEGLRARLLSSGNTICKKLNCKEPTGPELMTYMHVLYQICPFYKFAYNSANASILEAMEKEDRIHVIDFQVAQGTQWMGLLKALVSRRQGPPSYVRVTGVDDSQSAFAHGGGMYIVGRKLSDFAASVGVPFEFHGAAMDGCRVEIENLNVRPVEEEALAVNFPYMLHHMPDESVTVANHRDRLIRLVKGLSPRVVTLVEQESNTNTSSFVHRFKETVDYYTAMFEAIEVGRPEKGDKERMRVEENCVARDVVNMVACEGEDRVERHEPFGKWSYRLRMAGFEQLNLGSTVGVAVTQVLKDYSDNFRVGERDGAIYLGWKNRPMATTSAWR